METTQTKKEEIGGHEFFITRLPATAGLDLLTEILQGVGPAAASLVETFRIGEIMAARAAGKSLTEALAGVNLTGFGEAVKKLVMALGKKELRSIAAQALATTTCATAGGKRVWEGSAPLVDGLGLTARQTLELIWAAVAWNYADFFSGPSGSESKRQAGPGSRG